ncbi:MAG: serine/threonine protein kinase [Burkholderiales bacterium]|nr:MAG: serine/threonine protein kinase [Burkholderiales bacterium]
MTAEPHDNASHALPAGTRFGELEIIGTLGVGGFGIVYLARDHSLEREVAIKEYMPSQFASRDGRSQVSVRSVSMRDTFDLGRRSFVNEAKLLARFDHPSLLKVYRFWEANGTAYMVMPRLVGANLREAAKAQSTPPPYAWVRRLFDAVLGGLEVLHAQQVWHRDVAPDNIFLPADGSPPILLDFGAARQAISDQNQVFTAILKPSFAPIEQYAEATSLRQGPWTDLYALAAVMHELLTGHPPPPATARAMTDERVPLATVNPPGYPAAFLAGLDWALRVRPHQRPQSAAEWREVLDGRAEVPARRPPPPRAVPVPPPPPPPAAPLDLEFADTVQVMPSQFEVPSPTVAPAPAPRSASGAASAARAASVPRRRPAWLIAAGLAALLLLGLFAWQLPKRPGPLQATVAEPAASAVDVPASAAVMPAASEPASMASAAPVLPATAPAVAAATPPVRPASAAPRREAAARPVITEKAGEFKPVPQSPVLAAPEPVASTAVVAAPRPEPVAPAEPRTASEACGGRVLFARAWCIDRQCEKPIYKNDPECVRLRDLRESRANH